MRSLTGEKAAVPSQPAPVDEFEGLVVQPKGVAPGGGQIPGELKAAQEMVMLAKADEEPLPDGVVAQPAGAEPVVKPKRPRKKGGA
jgi:hypothetical protein